MDHDRKCDQIARHLWQALCVLGISVDVDNFKDTHRRIARLWLDMKPRELDEVLHEAVELLESAVFPSDYDQMILVKGIRALGLCPHHMLPVEYSVTVGYIPNEDDKRVVGISKIPRVVKLLAAQPILQESYTELIAAAIEKALDPLGTGVIVSGRHSCMYARGVRQDSPVVTSVMHGALRDKPQARAEFLMLAQ